MPSWKREVNAIEKVCPTSSQTVMQLLTIGLVNIINTGITVP